MQALARSWPPLASLAAAAALWEAVGRLHLSIIVPPLSDVLATWLSMLRAGEVTGDLATSLLELGIGFGAALALALVIGVAMGRYGAVDTMLAPYVNAFLVAPTSALVPVLALLFGLGSAPIVVAVFMFAFFPMVINFSAGIRAAPGVLQEMARAYGANEAQILRRIVIPAALPLMLTGVRLGMARAIKGLIIGEILIAVVGIGGRIETYGNSFELEPLYALLLTIVAIAVALTSALRLVQRGVAPWYFSATEERE